MNEIIKEKKTGRVLLIEHDAGFLSYNENTTLITEGFDFKIGEPILVNCILQKWGVKNKNGRIYPREVLVSQVTEYQKLVDANCAVSESDHPECVRASESMICTKDGWKTFEDISNDEEILTLNIETNQIEIQKIDEKIYENFKGKLYNFKGKHGIELTVTENHRFLIERNNKREYYTVKEILNDKNGVFSSGKSKILKTGEWIADYNEYFTLAGVNRDSLSYNSKHESIEKYTTPINIKSEDWFAFMGIYLSEGHCTGTKSDQYKLNGYSVIITQKKEETKLLIEELLNKLPFDFWKSELEDGKCQYHINDARLYNYLYPLGYSLTKYIPIELKQASSNLLKILFKWFMIGDGRSITSKITGKNVKESVFSISEKLINDLHEILIKTGGSGNISKWQPKDRYLYDYKILKKENILSDGTIEYLNETIKTKRLVKAENSHLQYNLNISKSKNFYLDKRFIKIEEIDFNDNIACVKVKNSNFLVKVNGKSHWTGNSSTISLQNISHMITKMWWGDGEQENILYGQIKLIVSPGFVKYGVVSVIGDKIVLYLQNKIKLGISSRGVGSLKEIRGENIVQSDFELIGFDLVSTPSTPGAFLFPVTTGSSSKVFGEEYRKNDKGIYLNENDKIENSLNNFLLL